MLLGTGEGPGSGCHRRRAGRGRWSLTEMKHTHCRKPQCNFLTGGSDSLKLRLKSERLSPALRHLEMWSEISPRPTLPSEAAGPRNEGCSFGERRDGRRRRRFSRCTWSAGQRRDTSCLQWKTWNTLEQRWENYVPVAISGHRFVQCAKG